MKDEHIYRCHHLRLHRHGGELSADQCPNEGDYSTKYESTESTVAFIVNLLVFCGPKSSPVAKPREPSLAGQATSDDLSAVTQFVMAPKGKASGG